MYNVILHNVLENESIYKCWVGSEISKMATIKDIAKKAGVSHGTVSNVLNKKGNVSADKIKKVERVAQELGYTLNRQAAGLRKGSLNLITVIIPYQCRERYDEFYSGMLLRAEEKEFDISLVYLTVRAELKKLLDRETAKMPHSIVLLGINPKEEEIKQVTEKVKIYIYNDVPDYQLENMEIWFYDAEKVVKEVREEIVNQNKSNNIFIVSNIFEQDSYWVNELNTQFPNKKIQKVFLDSSNRLSAYFELLNKATSNDTILFLDLYIAQNFLNVIGWSNIYEGNLPYIISFSPNQELHNPLIKYYEFNYKKDGYYLVTQMIRNKKKTINNLLPSYHFFNKNFVFNKKNKSSIRILTLESPMSDVMNQLTPIFEKESGIKVEIIQDSYLDLRNKIFQKNQKELKDFDLIRIDVAWLESIGETIFKPLEDNPQIKKINKSLINLPKEYTLIQGIQYGLPLDASMQILFYRKDLFDDLLIKRQFFEMYNHELKVPKTFKEFDEVSQYFSKSINSQSPIEYGHSYVQDNPDLLVSSVLPRINEKLKIHCSLSQTEILEETIEEYKKTEVYSHKLNNVFWSNVARNFANGLTAMEILYSNYAGDILISTEHFDKTDIGYSLIPGKKSLLGGGSIGISKETNKYKESIQFLEWLYSDEISQLITSLGGVLHNKRTNENIDIIEMYPWMRKMDEYFKNSNRLMLGNQQITYEKELQIGEYILEALKINK